MKHCQWCGKEFKLEDVKHKMFCDSGIYYFCDICHYKITHGFLTKTYNEEKYGPHR